MSVTSVALNTSAHTFSDLKTLAQSAPAEAEAYLRSVAAKLEKSGQTAGAQAINAMLQATGDLVARIDASAAQLGQVFPTNAGEWAALQTARANTVGWAPVDPNGGVTWLKGTVALDGATFKLTTPGGRVYTLAESDKVTTTWMARQMMAGVLGDGPLSLQGTLGQDGATFNVEGFALNRDGRYDTFTYARVTVNGADVVLNTPRGDVQIADPAFKAKMLAMPRLGVILPGEPKVNADGTRVYEGSPTNFFGLGRFKQTAVSPADAAHPQQFALADMAYSSFSGKPCSVPAGSEGRVNHTGRVWFEGDVKLDANGVAQSFEATYVGIQCDNTGALAGVQAAADPVETAVITSEVV